MCVYLLLVPHGALPSDHDLAAGLGLQLFGCQSSWAQDPPHEVELEKKKQNTHTHTSITKPPCTFGFDVCLCICDVFVLPGGGRRGTEIAHYMAAQGRNLPLTLSVSGPE